MTELLIDMCRPEDEIRECTMSPHGIRRPVSVSPVRRDPIASTKPPLNTCLPAVARLSHPNTYYNPARKEIYKRYSQCDWDASYKANVRLSERERGRGEVVRSETWRSVNKTEYQAKLRQCANTKRLGQRAYDISFWKEELLTEINAMDREIQRLIASKELCEKTVEEVVCNLKISEECLLQREKRTGIDQIRDEVEMCLTKENLLLKKAKRMLELLIEKCEAQLKLNREAQHACDLDMRDKQHSQNIDERIQVLHNNSPGIAFHPGIEYQDDTISVVRTWIKFSKENLQRSERSRECSERLRGHVDSTVRALANQMWSQFNVVNHALAAKINETTNVKANLQDHLIKVNIEINDMERNIDLLRKAGDHKDQYIKVAQTRLEARVRRMNVELTHDPPMTGLQHEVEELRRSNDLIKHRLHDSQMSLCRLLKTRNALQNDIAIKDNTLQLDYRCLSSMRKSMALDPYVALAFNMPSEAYHTHSEGVVCNNC